MNPKNISPECQITPLSAQDSEQMSIHEKDSKHDPSLRRLPAEHVLALQLKQRHEGLQHCIITDTEHCAIAMKGGHSLLSGQVSHVSCGLLMFVSPDSSFFP